MFFSMKHFSDHSKHHISSRMTGSIQSLRDAVHRIPKPHHSSSRTSLNSEQKTKDETIDSTSSRKSEQQNLSSMYPTWSSG